MEAKIQVEGLAALSRALKRVDNDAPKGLRIALNSAADLLVKRTVPKIPRRTGAAAKSLKAKSTRTSARVSMGGTRASYMPWLDFGGQGRRPGRPPHRQFIKEGRYLCPTLGQIRPEIEAQLEQAITDVVKSAGLEVE